MRSEQIDEDESTGSGFIASGIPGSLSNQPPVNGAADATAEDASESQQLEPKNTSRSSTRNYEVDRTIRHTRPQSGAIQRLSVAVLVDDTPPDPDSGQAAVSDADIERYTSLVKEAVGFSEARGDTVVILSEQFLSVAPLEEPEEPAIWQLPIFQDAAKQILGAIVALAIAFGVVRPMLRGVVSSGAGVSGQLLPGGEYAGGYGAAQVAGGGSPMALPNYEEKVAAAKNITGHDPARVAQVVKKWVTADE